MGITITLKGDKSLSHRYLIFANLIQSPSQLQNLSNCEDVIATKQILEQIKAPPYQGSFELNCHNSGTTLRLMTGLLAGFSGSYQFTGDESLLKRPMQRLMTPLKQIKMGNHEIELPIASAQVKSGLLLYALATNTPLTLTGKIRSRDHTEIFLAQQALNFQSSEDKIFLHDTYQNLKPFQVNIPGDPSSAAFLILYRLLHAGPSLTVENLLLNPTRVAYLQLLKEMGARINIEAKAKAYGEMVGSVHIEHTPAKQLQKPNRISADMIALLIDELPMLISLLVHLPGETLIEQVQELTTKESNRVAELQRLLGKTAILVQGDDLLVKTLETTTPQDFQSIDHRLQMCAAVLTKSEALANDPVIGVSYPEFASDIRKLLT